LGARDAARRWLELARDAGGDAATRAEIDALAVRLGG
jgi:hypothetical protein